jgi:hypothetical protein
VHTSRLVVSRLDEQGDKWFLGLTRPYEVTLVGLGTEGSELLLQSSLTARWE